jgi:hypothetical protein
LPPEFGVASLFNSPIEVLTLNAPEPALKLELSMGRPFWLIRSNSVGRLFALVLLLLATPTLAQQFPETERQKAEQDRERAQAAHKKANQQMIDEDYKSMMEQTPRSNKKVDP